MNKFREILRSSKAKIGIGSLAIVTAIPLTPYAAGGQSAAVSTALGTIASDITSTITAVAPVALGIVGIFLTWKYGMRFFKSISK